MSRFHLPIVGMPLVGTPTVRDVDGPCEDFWPGEPEMANSCEGDGHYMCEECKNWKLQVRPGDQTRFTRILEIPFRD